MINSNFEVLNLDFLFIFFFTDFIWKNEIVEWDYKQIWIYFSFFHRSLIEESLTHVPILGSNIRVIPWTSIWQEQLSVTHWKKNLIQTVVPEDRDAGTSDGRLSRAAHSGALRSSLPFNSIQHLILPSPHSVLKFPSFSLWSHSLHKEHVEYHQLKTAHSTVDTYDLNSMHTDMIKFSKKRLKQEMSRVLLTLFGIIFLFQESSLSFLNLHNMLKLWLA